MILNSLLCYKSVILYQLSYEVYFNVGMEGIEPSSPSGHLSLSQERFPFRHTPIFILL